MRLICCELRPIVGLATIAVETGLSPAAVKRALVKHGVRPSRGGGFNSCSVYDSRLVRDVFKKFNPEYPA